jgi:hypothetical protein
MVVQMMRGRAGHADSLLIWFSFSLVENQFLGMQAGSAFEELHSPSGPSRAVWRWSSSMRRFVETLNKCNLTIRPTSLTGTGLVGVVAVVIIVLLLIATGVNLSRLFAG